MLTSMSQLFKLDPVLLDRLGEMLPVALFLADADGRCLYANTKLGELAGLSVMRVLGLRWYERVYPEDQERAIARWAACVAQEREFCAELRLGEAGKQPRWVLAQVRAVRGESGELHGYAGNFTDINVRKQAEQMLLARQDQNRKILDRSVDGFFSASNSGLLHDANPAYCKLVGYPLEELRGMSVTELEAKETADEVYQRMRRIKKVGYDRFESSHRHKRGHPVDLELSVNFDLGMNPPFFTFVRDISERKHNEEELFLHGRIMASLAEGVNLVDSEGKIAYTNACFDAMFGYERGELIGHHVSRLNAPGEHSPQETAAYILEALDRHGVWRGDVENRRKDGSRFWCHLGISVFEHSRLGHTYISVHTDITERREAARTQSRLETQLRQAQKMQAIGTLAGGIAHEFNNILGVILGNADMLSEDLPEDSETHAQARRILKAGNQARELVKQILAFSRADEQKRAYLSLSVLVKEALKFLQTSIPVSVKLHQNIKVQLDTVWVDPNEVNQILMNLCANAVQAMNEQGMLEVGLKNVELSAKDLLQFPDLGEGEYLCLWVRDNGGGMSAEVRERAFEPFFTTKEVGQGTGMGLALVYGIVDSYGGGLKLDSAPGLGTTVYVLLPLARHAVNTALTVSLPRAFSCGGKNRLMVVEDKAEMMETLLEILQRLGYTAEGFTDGERALAQFQAAPASYDLVILDQVMPGISGKDLSLRLLELRPGLPIVMSTGYSSQVDEASAHALGICGFIMKPFETTELAELLSQILAHNNQE